MENVDHEASGGTGTIVNIAEVRENMSTSNQENIGEKSTGTDDNAMSSFWPPQEEEFVLVLLEDGFYVGRVEGLTPDKLYFNYMVPKCSNGRQHWVWPERKESEWVDKEFVMEIYPSLRIDLKLSTKRKVVYELLNEEIINVFLTYS